MSNDITRTPTPRTDALQHGGERLDRLAKELSEVDEVCYRAAVEDLYMDAAGQLERRTDGFRNAIDLCVEKDRKIDQLKAEITALRKDRERLDWLSINYETRINVRLSVHSFVVQWDHNDDYYFESVGDSLRAAIDAAMKGGE